LEDDRILYRGQQVAVVVARTREQAVAAARLVEIDYEEAVPVLSLNDPRAPVLLDRWGLDVDRGDVTPRSPPPRWPMTRPSPRRR
jgi:xanthine dehydrogenase YagR molybdenum-binding subunit